MDARNCLIHRADSACHTELEDEVIVLNSIDDKLYRLNKSASKLWQALEQPKTLTELTAFMAEAYGHLSADDKEDISGWVADNQEKGLLVCKDLG